MVSRIDVGSLAINCFLVCTFGGGTYTLRGRMVGMINLGDCTSGVFTLGSCTGVIFLFCLGCSAAAARFKIAFF